MIQMELHQKIQVLAPSKDGILYNGNANWGVLLFHGFTSGPESVLDWGKALAKAGATVHIPTLSGHRTSVEDLQKTTASHWRKDAQHTFDLMASAGYKHLAVAGISMGGTLALDVAANRHVDAVLVVNPGLSFKPTDQLGVWLSPLLQYVVPYVGPLAGDIKQPGRQEVAYHKTPVAAVFELSKLFKTVRSQLARISAPVTLFLSATDHIVPATSATLLGNALVTDQLTKVMLHHSYHVATLDYDAHHIEQQSVASLNRLSGG